MPSHIFTRLGLWDDAIASNAASANAAMKYEASSGMPGVWDQELHALDYLVYAYLQGAQDRRAAVVLQRIAGVSRAEPPVQAAAYTLAASPVRYALERRDWKGAAALELPRANIRWESYRWSESNVYFAVALGAARSGDLPRARQEVARLAALYEEIRGRDKYAGLIEAQRRIASAWIAQAEGRFAEALTLHRSAADLEESIEKHPVTPGMVLPARELLGDLLLEQGRPAEALQAYEATLKHSPRRFNSIAGAMRAAERAGDGAAAVRHARELLALSAKADSPRAGITEARRIAAGR
jgi:tetratricopeptide (TPR) repeat protein